ncbi:hypothetical protein F2P56_025861, partial [Juglans regia]
SSSISGIEKPVSFKTLLSPVVTTFPSRTISSTKFETLHNSLPLCFSISISPSSSSAASLFSPLDFFTHFRPSFPRSPLPPSIFSFGKSFLQVFLLCPWILQ